MGINNSFLINYGKISTSSSYSSWSMPTLSSNTKTVTEGTITCSNNGGSSDAYKIWNSLDNTTVVNISGKTVAYSITFPYQLKITGLKWHSGKHAASNYSTCDNGGFYTDSTKSTPIGNKTTSVASNTEYTISGIPSNGVITNTLYFEGTHTGAYSKNNILGIGITAQKLTTTLNSIVFPMSFTGSTTYGASVCYVANSTVFAYVSSKSSTGISLSGVDSSITSATYLTCGY